MNKANYVVLDCETGGYEKSEHPITQIALISLDSETLKETGRFEFYIKPYNDLKITQGALDVTGLKMVDINNGYSVKEAVKLISNFCRKSAINGRPENRPIMVGHNTQFDKGFIKYLYELDKKDINKSFSPTTQCTMVMSKNFFGEVDSLKLEKCCEKMGVVLSGAHRAMNDTAATAELFRRFIKTMRGNAVKTPLEEKVKTKKSRDKFQF